MAGEHNHWVSIQEAAIALGVNLRRAYQLARTESWRRAPGQRPRQYLFADVHRTYEQRKTS